MKVELKCEYCDNEISENDKKCPSCGASCSNVTKKYREEKEKLQKERRQEIDKNLKKAVGISAIPVVIFFILIISVFIFIGHLVSNQLKDVDNDYTEKEYDNDFDSFFDDESENEEENVEVGYNEKAVTSDYEVVLSSYDLYEYDSNFKSERTRDGYQKIAFEFDIKNVSSDDIYGFNIELKADGYNVEKANLSEHFGTLKQGSGDYPELKLFIFKSGDEQKGYIGFEVPKNKKELDFRVGDNVTIKMDNPAYK